MFSHICLVDSCFPQDLKDEKKRARMAAARAVLEKCTMMLLTASKVGLWKSTICCLKHVNINVCISA